MAQEYYTLAQITPAAGVLTNLHVTDASTQAVIGTITVSGLFEPLESNSTFSIAVRPINEVLEEKHFIFRGSPVPSGEVLIISGAVTMGPNTILAANNYTGNAHFTVYGVEIT
jgi:hypothetical protein